MYGAKPKEQNDPMEGKFNPTNLSKDDYYEIRKGLDNTRICSLLTKQDNQSFPNDYLMWSHYADSHNGCSSRAFAPWTGARMPLKERRWKFFS
jgi:hypothetical protein